LKLIDQNQNKLNNKKMGKSKVRGGAKAHRQRVANRNQNIKTQQSAIQKLFNETMKLQMEEFKKKQEENQSTPSNTEE
jgi:hypothetical protein